MKKTLLALSLFTSLFAAAQTGHEINGSFTSGGVVRTYRLYVPLKYDTSHTASVPLIFNFHGLGGTSTQQESYGDFRKIADTANFIIVHPQGLPVNFGIFTQNAFNLFAATSLSQPDIDFVSHLIDSMKAHYNINMNRIYSTGMSNGGFMSYEMACRLSGRFAAVASVCGSMEPNHYNRCSAVHPTPLMEIHGTADGVVKYDGTPGSTIITFTHIDTLMKHWVKYNNCISTPTIDTLPNDPNPIDSARAVHYVWSGGDHGSTVELYKIIGGVHAWPNPAISSKGTCKDFSASKEIWRFFSQQKSFVGIEEQAANETDFNVYPNPSNGIFTVSISNTNSSTLSISVIDILGQEVFSLSDKNSSAEYQKEINLAHLATGIYSIKLIIGTDVKTRKLIIQ